MEKIPKRLFQFKSAQNSPSTSVSASPVMAHSTGLQPKFTVPPVPHPTPHYRLAILATPGGLLIRPVIPGVPRPSSLLRMPWGTSVTLQELPGDSDEGKLPGWTQAAVVYGVLGCLKLNSGMLSVLINKELSMMDLHGNERRIRSIHHC